MNVIQKIKEIANEKGWTEYRLVKESGLAPSTISNIYHRNTIPSIPTLEILCDTFGITLSQFFAEAEPVSLSAEQKQLLEYWAFASHEQKTLIIELLKTLK